MFRDDAPAARARRTDFHRRQERVNRNLLVLHRLPERPAHYCGRLRVGVLDRAKVRVDGAVVLSPAREDAGDHAALVLGCDRGVLAGPEGHVELPGPD